MLAGYCRSRSPQRPCVADVKYREVDAPVEHSRRSVLQSLATSAGWLTVSQAAAQGATLLCAIVLANVLGTSRFGEYSFLQSTLNNLSLIAQLSFGILATRFLASDAHSDPQRAGQLLGLGTVLTLANGCLLALALLALATLESDTSGTVFKLATPLVAIALAIPLAAIVYFQIGILQGLQRFKVLANLATVQSIFAVIIPCAGGWVAGVEGAAVGLAAVVAIRCCGNALVIRRLTKSLGIKTAYRWTRELKQSAFRFAIPASLTGVTTSGGQWAISLLLLHLPDGAYQMGCYAIGLNFRTLALFVPNQLGSAALAMLSRQFADGNATSYSRILRLNVAVTLVCVLLAVVGLAVATPAVLNLFGADAPETRLVAYVMLAAALVEALCTALYQRLPSQARMWTSFFYVALPRDACFCLVAWTLVETHKALGLAIALAVSQVLALGGIFAATRRPS